MRTRVKICGIKQLEHAVTAVESGADALGFVFYEKSSRNVSIEKAAEIVSQLPAFVTITALLVNADVEQVNQIIQRVKPDLLQFHGDESPEFCEQFNRPYMKAIRMQEDTDLVTLSQSFKGARALLLDTCVKGVPGGTGESFNWNWIGKNTRSGDILPIVLAGGLNSENVSEAIDVVAPWAVDVSGGVEVAPGVKSSNKIQQFINSVNSTL